jgi:prepilin-type N-terminal cleavage/methylation domain-containing protein
MNNQMLRPGYTRQIGSPFICQKIPFVCLNNPLDKPLVCKNIPFIGFGSFGFTLVELIVTLTIVGILSALAGPAITTLIANQRLSGQANDLLADLTYSRSEAVKRSSGFTIASGVTICKTADPNAAAPDCNANAATAWTAGRIIFIDNNADGVRDANDQILRIRQELEGGASSGNQLLGDGDALGTGVGITFLSTGATKLVLGPEYQLTLCDKRGDSFGLAVAIHALGRARVVTRGKNVDGTAITDCP